eukprot:g11008.t1
MSNQGPQAAPKAMPCSSASSSPVVVSNQGFPTPLEGMVHGAWQQNCQLQMAGIATSASLQETHLQMQARQLQQAGLRPAFASPGLHAYSDQVAQAPQPQWQALGQARQHMSMQQVAPRGHAGRGLPNPLFGNPEERPYDDRLQQFFCSIKPESSAIELFKAGDAFTNLVSFSSLMQASLVNLDL